VTIPRYHFFVAEEDIKKLIESTAAETQRQFAELRQQFVEMQGQFGEMQGQFAEVRQEIKDNRNHFEVIARTPTTSSSSLIPSSTNASASWKGTRGS